MKHHIRSATHITIGIHLRLAMILMHVLSHLCPSRVVRAQQTLVRSTRASEAASLGIGSASWRIVSPRRGSLRTGDMRRCEKLVRGWVYGSQGARSLWRG